MSVGAAAGLLSSGAIGDDFGRRRTFIAGCLVLLVASLLASVAPNSFVFVVARVLNAIGLFNPPGPPTLARSVGIVATLAILLGLTIWLLVLIHLPMLR